MPFPRRRSPRRVPLLTLLMLVLACAGSAAAKAFDPFASSVAGNPADRMLDVPMDDFAYDRAERCVKQPRAGAVALVKWLQANAAGQFWGIMRCEKWGKNSASLHAEGRAIDWHLDARRPGERRAAERLVRLLLAPDKRGNPTALARRMGVQEIIYNCRSWWGGEWGKYSACYGTSGKRKKRLNVTVAHIDHIHIGLSKRGAAKRTSFWKRHR